MFGDGLAFAGSEAKGEGDATDEQQKEERGNGFMPFDEQGGSAKKASVFRLGCETVLEGVDVGCEGFYGDVAFFGTECEGL